MVQEWKHLRGEALLGSQAVGVPLLRLGFCRVNSSVGNVIFFTQCCIRCMIHHTNSLCRLNRLVLCTQEALLFSNLKPDDWLVPKHCAELEFLSLLTIVPVLLTSMQSRALGIWIRYPIHQSDQTCINFNAQCVVRPQVHEQKMARIWIWTIVLCYREKWSVSGVSVTILFITVALLTNF